MPLHSPWARSPRTIGPETLGILGNLPRIEVPDPLAFLLDRSGRRDFFRGHLVHLSVPNWLITVVRRLK
jgi:hypothetical protein